MKKENRESVLEHLKPYIDAAHEMKTPSKFNIRDIGIDLSVDTVRFLKVFISPPLKPNDQVCIDAKFGIDWYS